MKKRELIFFSLFVLFTLNVILINAEINSTPQIPIIGDINESTGQPIVIEKIDSIKNNLSTEDLNKIYLKAELYKILLKKPYIGPFITTTESYLAYLNPVWKLTVGIEFSWSFIFFFSLIIYIFFIIFFFKAMDLFLKLNPILTLLASFIITTLANMTGVIVQAATALDFAVSNTAIALLSIILAICAIIFYDLFMKKVKKRFKKEEKEEKLQRSEDRINAAGDSLKKLSD